MSRTLDELNAWWRSEPVVVAGIVSTREEYADRLVRDCGLSKGHAGSVAAAPYTKWRPCTFLLGISRGRALVAHVDRLPGATVSFYFQIDFMKGASRRKAAPDGAQQSKEKQR